MAALVRVGAFASTIGARYTRYADDLVLSGESHLMRAATSIVGRVSAIAIEEGFAVNTRKTRVMGASDRQRVTGVVVNKQLSAGREEIERLRAMLHNCTRTGPAAQNHAEVPDFRAHLAGRIGWIASLEPDKGARLRKVFDLIDWRLVMPRAAFDGLEVCGAGGPCANGGALAVRCPRTSRQELRPSKLLLVLPR